MEIHKEEFEQWFRDSGYNENGEEDFKAPWWENSGLTYEEEFVECSYRAYLAGMASKNEQS